ncbi:hepatic leukemia factor-like isoform X1 [Periophthalmus magnuspinnatus]|uniref:hepatic leukemia factor-like isoform X1 n=1 Tax=Periophthalmus magnuspinnatus TaxID=409849 RepID=UPI00243684D7|nr:hepatic leukemia factor-like isoform X1 [Periophthalmus magnuspinnatus]
MEKVPRPYAHMHPAFLPLSGHGVLKSLLEKPVKLPLHHEGSAQLQEKQKSVEEEEDERAAPQSAFLGPTLWDKTLPYDTEGFQLEYMDLEEFLYENIPPSPAHNHTHQHKQPIPPTTLRQPISSQGPTKVIDLSHASTSSCLHQSPPPPGCVELPLSSGLSEQRNTPSPIDPDSIQIPVGFDPDPVDLALSTVPGQEVFDPRKRSFSTEELKPQPMIKKARKVYMPEDLKDERYWARRRKNNMAAKRSRDARRLKENQIAIRAAFLEKENSALRQEVADLRQELGRTNNVLSRYQARHGPV